MRKHYEKCYPFRRKVISFCQLQLEIGFSFLVPAQLWRWREQGLSGVSRLPPGRYLRWHQHGCTARGSLALVHSRDCTLPSFTSQALRGLVFRLRLLALPDVFAITPGSLDPVFFFQTPQTSNSTTTVRVLGERVRQQNIAPGPAYLFNACFLRHATCWHPSKWVTAFLPRWQPGMKKPPCPGGHPWLWVTGFRAAINLPAGFGCRAGIWDKRMDARSRQGWGDRGLGWRGDRSCERLRELATESLQRAAWLEKTCKVHGILADAWSLA